MKPVKQALLKAPFPWFGGKQRAAALIWERLGDVNNYVEPFFGSGAVLLGRPTPPNSETVNDIDCYLSNFWRAIQADPEAVAYHADWQINEADLHARHLFLVNQVQFRERMKSDPGFFDVKLAGWWVWGLSQWIGGGWCAIRSRPERHRPQMVAGKSIGVHQKIPQLHPKGCNQTMHPHYVRDQIPDLCAMSDRGANNTENLIAWFLRLRDRLRRTRVACGDWKRVLGNTPLGLTANVPPGFKTAIVLDPPYDKKHRDKYIYAQDSEHDLSSQVRAWAIKHGNDHRLRIVLCGYEDEHAMPADWQCVQWKAAGGYGNRRKNENAQKERLWFSPHCLDPRRDELPLSLDSQSTATNHEK